MISLKTYLTESADAGAAFAKAQTYLGALRDAGNPKSTAARMIVGLKVFADGIAAKEIYNGAFKETYSYRVSRGLEDLWSRVIDDNRAALKLIDGYDDFWGVNMQNVKKAHAFFHKNNAPREVLMFLDAMVDLPDAIKVLKTYIKMGRPPKVSTNTLDIAKAAVVAKHDVSAESLLKDAVASFKAELHADTIKSFNGWYEQLKDITDPKLVPNSPSLQALASMLFVTRHGYTDDGLKRKVWLQLKPDAQMLVQRLANETVEKIVGEFVEKNNRKLSLIFKKKGAPTEHRIVRTTIRSNTLENTMSFKFADGSSFMIDSNVVIKYTQTGKPFAQMPTRFRNVVMADGSVMSKPSEEKMIRTF